MEEEVVTARTRSREVLIENARHVPDKMFSGQDLENAHSPETGLLGTEYVIFDRSALCLH